MAFMVYSKKDDCLCYTGEYFSLGGYNLIYQLWEKRGKPTNHGWHMSADDLIREYTEGSGGIDNYSFLIDFHPNAKNRIGIIELLDIYAYTYSDDESENEVEWTPMMLRLRDVLYYVTYDKEITVSEKEEKIKKLKDPNNQEDFIEFLYLNGPAKGWNWGRNGSTNAAFIQKPAREYFRKYF